ncbi:MAG: hypothetical protein WC114_05690 [Smithellaceae bacterium]|jgi:hypothetical protein
MLTPADPSGSDDRTSIADLEIYGLPLYIINLLEARLGILYVDQLEGKSAEELLAMDGFHDRRLKTLRDAVRRYLDGTPVKTVGECIGEGF